MHAFEKLKVPDHNLGIHWFGQNSFAFKDSMGTLLMVDPHFPRERPKDEFIHAVPPLFESEMKPNIVLLTHDHGDHTCPESLLRIHAAHPGARFYAPAESISRLKSLGIPFDLLTEMTAGDSKKIGSITIHAFFSKPPHGVSEEGIPIPDVEHLGYGIEMGSVRLYVSGDLIHTFSTHEELLAPIHQFKPDIGLLTTHPTEGEFPDFAGSVEMALKLGLKAVVPAHYGCFGKRTFDPTLWASGFPPNGPQPIILPYNTSIIYHT